MNEAERDLPPEGNKLARVASLIMKDFDARCFDDVNFRKLNEKFVHDETRRLSLLSFVCYVCGIKTYVKERV